MSKQFHAVLQISVIATKSKSLNKKPLPLLAGMFTANDTIVTLQLPTWMLPSKS